MTIFDNILSKINLRLLNVLFFWLFLTYSLSLTGQERAPLKIEKLNSRINSANYHETNPVVSRDGSTLYFTRVGHPGFKRTLIQDGMDLSGRLNATEYDKLLKDVYEEIAAEKNHDPHASPFNQDIWIAHTTEDGEFAKIEHPDHPVNNALPNSVCSLTPHPDELVIVNEFYTDGSMYKGFSILKRQGDKGWLSPKPIYIYDMNEYGSDVNLNMSADGEVLILSINRKDTYGDNDLYVSFKVSDNKWSAPINLGPQINSPFRETTPYLSSDKQTLYFASNRPGGIGGTDMYVSRRLDKTFKNWSRPQLLESPINSIYDDAQPFLNEATGYLYFASTREGDSNIYRVLESKLLQYVDLPEVITMEINRESNEDKGQPEVVESSPPTYIERVQSSTVPEADQDLPLKIQPPKETSSSEVYTVHCSIIDSKTGRLVEGRIKFGLASAEKQTNTVKTTRGEVSFNIKASSLVKVYPEVPGYIVTEKFIHPGKEMEKGNTEQSLVFFIDPIEENAQISLKPIYFERGKPIVLEESTSELDRLSAILQKHANIHIVIGGHTDHVGKPDELIQLSQERADAIKDYLLKRGIADSRIKTRGYGPTRPVSKGDDEASRSRNRRVEVIIDKVL
jgi:OOP family OmpA-OmpF porin